MKYALMLKNGGDLKVDGSTTEVKDNLVLLFETLSTAYAPQSETGSAANGESGMKMDVQAVMAMMGAVVKTHKDKEQKISLPSTKLWKGHEPCRQRMRRSPLERISVLRSSAEWQMKEIRTW